MSILCDNFFSIYSQQLIIFSLLTFMLSSVDEPKTGATTSQSSPVPQSFSAKHASMGLDTMNEVADKERFFQDVEGGSSSVDYKKKLKEISTSESADVQNQ